MNLPGLIVQMRSEQLFLKYLLFLRKEEAGGETGGHQEEVALHGNMSIPKALCVCVQYISSCPCLGLLAAGMNIRDAKVDNMCV